MSSQEQRPMAAIVKRGPTDVQAKTPEPRRHMERVCVACGEVESVHIHPAHLARMRGLERQGLGLVVAVQGISLRGSNCYECKGECLGHPWHHFVFKEKLP